MGLRHPPTLPSFRLSLSHSQILRGLAITRDFRVGRDLLVSSHPPLPRLLQWDYTASQRSIHLTGRHSACKFSPICRQRVIFTPRRDPLVSNRLLPEVHPNWYLHCSQKFSPES